MSNQNVNVQVGPGFPGLLFITFLVLKLTQVIDWSWWWVTSPLWIPVALMVTFFLLCLGVWGVIALVLLCMGRKVKRGFRVGRKSWLTTR